MSNFGERFGALIAAKREERGWSFATLAIAAYGDDGQGGESRKADVQKLEAGGSKKPNAATIRKFRLALDLTQEEIDTCRTVEEIELAQFARQLFEVISEAAKASGLSEDLALAVSEHYAQNNAGNFEGALAGLKDALKEAAKEQERGRLPSNYEQAVDTVVARINALNQDGQIDEAYVDLQAEASRRAEARAQQTAEDGRILDLLITQATLANDADGLAEAHLQRIRLESPGAEDSFHRLRKLWRVRREDGERFGTPFALGAAAGLARKCAAIAPTSYLRAMAENDLGGTLQDQGIRTQGPEGAALLGAAVDSYRAALRVFTEADHPVDWAMTMQNLAIALRNQGSRTQGPEGAALLGEAVDSYRAALRVRTEADHPVDWAKTMQNLANALQEQGSRSQGPEGAALLCEAVDSFHAALRVRTEAEHPVNWARTMLNLAAALKEQSIRTLGPEGAALLGDAADSYRAALRVVTEANHPVDWAITRANMAMLEQAYAAHGETPDPRPHLEAGLEHAAAALRVFDPENTAAYYDVTIKARNTLQAALNALPSSSS